MLMHYSMLEWARCGLHKKRAGTPYGELVFLHPLRSAGHVVYYGTPGQQNGDSLFLMLRWARCGFHKRRAETCYFELVFLHLV
jgi:hypothetical protein